MLQSERLNKIKKIVFEKKTVKIDHLCKELFFSLSTIRRDLIMLEKQGILTRNRGFVTITNKSFFENTYSVRESTNKNSKIKICELATTYIKDGMSIFIDASSTAHKIVPKLKDFTNLTIITNSLNLAMEVSILSTSKAIIIGGIVKPESFSSVDRINYKILDDYRADLSICSCRGVSKDGVFEASDNQIAIKKEMVVNSKLSILLCDSTKFNTEYFYKSGNFRDYDYFISDTMPTGELLLSINDGNCKIIC